MRVPVAVVLVVSVSLTGALRYAHAAEGTEIASSFDPGDPFDLFIGVDYAYEARRTAIKREFAGPDAGLANGPTPIVKDLVYRQNRHLLRPHLAIGIFHDVELNAALPIILSDEREYSFDQRAEPCIFASDPMKRQPTCIDRTNSTTLLDGFLPDGSTGLTGYDANDPITNFAPDSTVIFRGVNRSGIDQLHLGAKVALLSQERDDTKPTWVLGTEFRLSIGKIMRFSRLAPSSEDGVSRGVHEARIYTGLSKRTTWAEPFVWFWWQAPFSVRGSKPTDPQGSLFWDVGFGQENTRPQQLAGTTFGFEAIPYDNPAQHQKISLELTGRLEAHFEGVGYSEMWEPLAYAGEVKLDAMGNTTAGPLALDLDPTRKDDKPVSFPGTTEIQNYLTFGGRVGVRAEVGENAQFSASFELAHDQAHRITFTDAGKEGADADEVVTPDTTEVNPLHKQLIDLPGRRYLADETTLYTFLVSGTVLF